MDKKFKQIYYSDGGYWRGKSAIQRLAKASGSTKEEAEKWLLKQPLYQIYLPAPKYIPRPNASMSLFANPNDIHQSDLFRVPLHEPGLDVNPGQLTHRGKKQVLFTRARVAFVDYHLR